ncbi:DUF1499 domain-containing protein [Roseovarius amoyensis]|uniref:DUF1499 domain-containing protein n=1 Tax=Roseovarius amoyensis TaxID=2211448 RepID=UPI000DBE6458|nr:DUF1499 domain-containing protein [Roseovarius amoyensis]
MIRMVGLVALAGLIGVALYIRLAPSDAGRWHRMPEAVTAGDTAGGALRVIEADEADFSRLHDIILRTARTRVLAGSTDAGMITFVTRSRVFGFPDYTTLRHRDGRIEIWGRLRFGRSDLGVNARRIDGWLQALAQRG